MYTASAEIDSDNGSLKTSDSDAVIEPDDASGIECDHAELLRTLFWGRSEWKTLDTEESLFSDFLTFQRLEKDYLIETGLRKRVFTSSWTLDMTLSNLYPTRLPARVTVAPIVDRRQVIEYEWWADWFATSIPPIFRVPPADTMSGGYMYARPPDTSVLSPCWKLKHSLELTHDWKRGAKVPFLGAAECMRIERERAVLFEMKEFVLKQICDALVSRNASELRPRCVERLKQEFSAGDLKFYFDAEERYRFLIGAPYSTEEWMVDQTCGGLISLFGNVVWVEQALTEDSWDILARIWSDLNGVIQNSRVDLVRASLDAFASAIDTALPAEGMKGVEVLGLLGRQYEYFVRNAQFETIELLSSEFNVDLTMPKIMVHPDLAARTQADLSAIEGTLRDYLKDPQDKVLCVMPRGLRFVQDDLEAIGFRPNKGYGRVEWWDGHIWIPFEFETGEKRTLIQQLFEERAFDENSAIHETRLRASGKRMKDLFGEHPAWNTMLHKKSAKYWLQSIPPIPFKRT